jgi:uncharacterized protein YbgA (DUF1722 family)/uncharacterized protein YbbK (DUF523 family)
VGVSPPRIGVSACLLGRNVRWDGGHKRDAFLTDTLGPLVEWVPVCPEVELGLGTPRETIRLERHADGVRLVMNATREDLTVRMRRYAEGRVRELEKLDLSGYVLKKDSPSCGVFRVRVHPEKGPATRDGRGAFAAVLTERLPLLPVEEEGRLHDPHLRENFIERVFAWRRLQDFFGGRWTVGGLVALHTSLKLLVMAHSPAAYKALGPLVAGAKAMGRAELRGAYCEGVMHALQQPATRGKHANVLQHMAGYVSEALDAADRAELASTIDDYRKGLVPLVVPVTLLRHHVRRQDVAYLLGQVYLDPHPRELLLRNHA